MRKIISILMTSAVLFFFGVTGSMADWAVGLTVTHGEYSATGEENENGEINKSNTQKMGATYPTIFVERAMDNGMSVGLDIIPGSVSSNEASRTDFNVGASTVAEAGNDGGTGSITNKASVDLSQHVTLYAVVPLMDTGAFARAGVLHVLVETKEDLATGSKYPDERIYGATVGLGYQHDTDAGFIRIEVGHTKYEEISLKSETNSSNIVKADLEGTFGKISIGKSF